MVWIRSCRECGSEFSIPYKSWLSKRFCSRRCCYDNRLEELPKNMVGLQLGRGWNRGLRGLQPWMNISGLRSHPNGYKQSDGWREKNRLAHLGQVPWNKGKAVEKIRGPNHWNWKGGVSLDARAERRSRRIKTWRKDVLRRADYVCELCGDPAQEADHIKPFCSFPDLRYDVTNGRALCHSCHLATPTYGGRAVAAVSA